MSQSNANASPSSRRGRVNFLSINFTIRINVPTKKIDEFTKPSFSIRLPKPGHNIKQIDIIETTNNRDMNVNTNPNLFCLPSCNV